MLVAGNCHWVFRISESGAYLLVWASGHDRRVPGQPLHTNFKLDGNGEALALISPDGTTVVHQYVFGSPHQQVSARLDVGGGKLPLGFSDQRVGRLPVGVGFRT